MTVAATLAVLAATVAAASQSSVEFDVIVYGATPAGIAAAVVASNGTGLRVALVEPTDRIGGMSVPGGIGLRDCDNFDAAFGNGSVARRWIDLNGEAYGVPYVLQPDVVVGNRSMWALLQSTPVQVRWRALPSRYEW